MDTAPKLGATGSEVMAAALDFIKGSASNAADNGYSDAARDLDELHDLLRQHLLATFPAQPLQDIDHDDCHLCGGCGEIETYDQNSNRATVPCPEQIAEEIAAGYHSHSAAPATLPAKLALAAVRYADREGPGQPDREYLDLIAEYIDRNTAKETAL